MLTAIVLLPLLGFVLNGVLATRLGGNRFGPRFVSAADSRDFFYLLRRADP